MSASIFWQPTETNRNGLDVGSPSSFIASLEKVFGCLPITLHAGMYGTLMAMSAAVGGDESETGRAYKSLADACSEAEIRVWSEY